MNARNENDLLLKYFLLWYEFVLERRSNRSQWPHTVMTHDAHDHTSREDILGSSKAGTTIQSCSNPAPVEENESTTGQPVVTAIPKQVSTQGSLESASASNLMIMSAEPRIISHAFHHWHQMTLIRVRTRKLSSRRSSATSGVSSDVTSDVTAVLAESPARRTPPTGPGDITSKVTTAGAETLTKRTASIGSASSEVISEFVRRLREKVESEDRSESTPGSAPTRRTVSASSGKSPSKKSLVLQRRNLAPPSQQSLNEDIKNPPTSEHVRDQRTEQSPQEANSNSAGSERRHPSVERPPVHPIRKSFMRGSPKREPVALVLQRSTLNRKTPNPGSEPGTPLRLESDNPVPSTPPGRRPVPRPDPASPSSGSGNISCPFISRSRLTGDPVDKFAGLLSGRALDAAQLVPLHPETESELARSPNLVQFLTLSRNNRRNVGFRPAAKSVSQGTPSNPAPPSSLAEYQLEVQSRAEMRRQRQEEVKRLKQERAEKARETERAEQQRREQEIVRERRDLVRESRERRLRQEEARLRRLRLEQQTRDKLDRADRTYRHLLVKRVFRALLLNVQLSRSQCERAVVTARRCQLRAALRRWRHYRATVAAEREQSAEHWRRTRLTVWALSRWKKYVHQQCLKRQAACDLSQLQRVQSALRAWQAAVTLSRARQQHKLHTAQQLCVRLTCAGALRQWRRLPAVLAEERAAEARKNRLRRIVRELIPDFQPPSSSTSASRTQPVS